MEVHTASPEFLKTKVWNCSSSSQHPNGFQRCPDGFEVESMDWRYPEMKAVEPLDFEVKDGEIHFTIRSLIVHGMCVMHLRPVKN